MGDLTVSFEDKGALIAGPVKRSGRGIVQILAGSEARLAKVNCTLEHLRILGEKSGPDRRFIHTPGLEHVRDRLDKKVLAIKSEGIIQAVMGIIMGLVPGMVHRGTGASTLLDGGWTAW